MSSYIMEKWRPRGSKNDCQISKESVIYFTFCLLIDFCIGIGGIRKSKNHMKRDEHFKDKVIVH